MPELPEVETVRRGLSQLLVGHVIKAVDYNWPKSFPNSQVDIAEFLLGSRVVAVRRRAKVLIIDLSSDYSLVIHLKMTGQLVYIRSDEQSYESKIGSHEKDEGTGRHTSHVMPHNSVSEADTRFGAGHPTDSLIGSLPDRSTRVIFELDEGARLFFNDQRKFGWVRLLPTVEISNIDFMKKVGPEPLEDSFTADIFYERLQRRKNSSIKAAILDQTVLAGVGNIYADEGLWGAKIHPASKVVDIPKSKIKNLYSELRAVLLLSIEKGGSTDKNYVNAEGKRGSYIDFARVFRREGLPCQRHPDTLIQKTRVAGRGTHVCPQCQIAPSNFLK